MKKISAKEMTEMLRKKYEENPKPVMNEAMEKLVSEKMWEIFDVLGTVKTRK